MFIAYLLLINTAAFIMFGADKHRARRGRRRVPEKQLFLAALAGGTAGALAGVYIFRHKTLHRRFTLGLPLILLAQLSTAVFLRLKS